MIRRPPRSTRTDTLFPTRRSSDLNYLTAIARFQNQDVEIIDVEKVLAEILGGPAGLSTALGETMQGLDAGGLKVLVVDDSRVARSQIEGVQIGRAHV